jgi:predicted nucleic acid-binding protein
MKDQFLLDSSFVIDLLNEVADGEPGPAMAWLGRHPKARLWISPVTMAEVMEGAEAPDHVRAHLGRYHWQGIHQAHAELAAALQRRSKRRMAENDAWQAVVAIRMNASLVGHDPKAFRRLGEQYRDHRELGS